MDIKVQLISGEEKNETLENDKNIHEHKNKTELGQLLPTEKPNKILGPLLVYRNKENVTEDAIDPNKHLKHPDILIDENPYYHKDKIKATISKNDQKRPIKPPMILEKQPVAGDKPIYTDKIIINKTTNLERPTNLDKTINIDRPTIKDGPNMYKPISLDKLPHKEKPILEIQPHGNLPSYIGPINPEFKQPQKPNKNGKQPEKNKPNKNELFITPPTISHENYIPEYQNPYINPNYAIPNKKLPKPQQTPHQVQIPVKGTAEDILQILSQHPELANYPPGSVLEIHNVPQAPNQPHYINPIINPNARPNVIPYQINQGQPDIEHILQELHKNNQHLSNTFIPFPNHHQYQPAQDGQYLLAQQNGPVFDTRPHRNLTRPGSLIFFS